MSQNTQIQWTDHTWPITAGCDKVSAGCKNCYAIPHSFRLAHNPNPKIAAAYDGVVSKGAIHGKLNWTGSTRFLEDRLTWPARWKKPARIFVGNMSDIFHPDIPDDVLNSIFTVMEENPRHTFQVLTKRPVRMEYFMMARYSGVRHAGIFPTNIWCGTSIEDPETATERLAHLRHLRSAVRFVSYEPALAGVCFGSHFGSFDWLIIGGESGSGARPFDVRWAEAALDFCREWRIPAFVKQVGARPYRSPEHDGATGFDIGLKDSHGGDIMEWPSRLQVRQFPHFRSGRR
jgi:protein gp37